MWQTAMTLLCQNVLAMANEDGTGVVLAQTQQELVVENHSTGAMLMAPQGATLLIVLPSPAGASSLPDRVTRALAELLSMDLTVLPSNGGDINLVMPRTPSPIS
jgi:hypothetical protein